MGECGSAGVRGCGVGGWRVLCGVFCEGVESSDRYIAKVDRCV